MNKKKITKTTPPKIENQGKQKKCSVCFVLPSGFDENQAGSHFQSVKDKLKFVQFQTLVFDTDLVCFPSAKDMENLQELEAIHTFLQRNLVSDGILVPTLSSAKASQGLFSRIGFWLQGVIERLFTGVEVHHSRISLALYPVQQYQDLIAKESVFAALTPLAMLREMQRQGGQIQELPIANLSVPTQGAFMEVFKGLGVWFKLVKEEFIHIPLKKGLPLKELISNGSALFYRFKFFVLALLGLLTMLFISKDYNVTWDEETNQESAELVFNYLTSFGSDTAMFDFSQGRNRQTNQHYGISFDVGAVAVQKMIKVFNPDVNIYAVRHALNAIVGFLVILFSGLLAWRVFNIRAGIIAMFVLYFSPSFFGHSFNNPKDIPFALGFVMGIYYLVRVIKEWPKPSLQSRVMLSVGLGYCLSIRAGGLLLFAFVIMFLGVLWLSNMRKSPSLKPFLRYGLPVIVLGYVLGIMFWPYALRQPLLGPLKALQEFENFSHLTYYELFEGVRMYMKPWHYIPKLIIITAPLVFLIGIPLLLLYFAKKKRLTSEKIVIALLLFSSVFPVFYTIYKGSYLYNGWRHMLFVYPGLVVIAAVGWSRLMDFFKPYALKSVVMGLLLVFSAPAIVFSIANHPYQYMYFNELVGGVKGANGNYELDYWNQTPREAMEWISKNKPELFGGDIAVNSNNPVETMTTFVPGSDSIQYRWTREYEWTKAPWEYAVWTHRTLNKKQILGGYWPPKGTIYTVDVAGVPVCAVVKRPAKVGYLGHKAFNEKNYDSALIYFKQALELEPLEEEYYRGLAMTYRILGNMSEAAQNFNKALEIRDGNYEAYFGLGEIYFTEGLKNQQQIDEDKLTKAEFYLKEAVFYKKNYSNAYFFLGNMHMLHNKQSEAMDAYRNLTSVNPSIPQGWQGIARVFINLQQADSALYYLNYAMQLAPQSAEVYYDISKAFQLKGDKQSAEQYMQKAMELMPK